MCYYLKRSQSNFWSLQESEPYLHRKVKISARILFMQVWITQNKTKVFSRSWFLSWGERCLWEDWRHNLCWQKIIPLSAWKSESFTWLKKYYLRLHVVYGKVFNESAGLQCQNLCGQLTYMMYTLKMWATKHVNNISWSTHRCWSCKDKG